MARVDLSRLFVFAIVVALSAAIPAVAEDGPTAPGPKLPEGTAQQAEEEKAAQEAKEKAAKDKAAEAEAKLREQLKQQAVLRLGQYRQSGWIVREQYEGEGRERLLLFTSSGPIVVDLVATIDGQPYFAPFEKMRAEMTGTLDPAQPLKWDDAIKNPKFGLGRFGYLGGANEQVRKQYVRQYDSDQDGLASAAELRLMLMQLTGGPPLIVQPVMGGVPAAPLMEVLDADRDGTLSEVELSKAAERLAARDANDDELVDLMETAGNNPNGVYAGGRQANQRTVTPLDAATDYAELRKQIIQRYGRNDGLPKPLFRADPRLFRNLDSDENGDIDAEELKKLATVTPFCTVTAALGKTGGEATGFSLTFPEGSSTAAPAKLTETSRFTSLELPGLRLQLGWGNYQPNYNFDAQAQQMLASYDTDKNGYLEKEEVEKVQPGIAQQFGMWDADADGKVFPAEIKSFYERQQAPQWNRVSVGALDSGNSLWELLDANTDGRLSLREVRTAAERIRKLDRDQDGKLAASELPSTFKLGIARGANVYQLLSTPGGGRYGGGFSIVQPAPNPAGNAPKEKAAWFARMDRNGDGDVSRREFLGTAEQFRELDANDDGFITRDEAEAKG